MMKEIYAKALIRLEPVVNLPKEVIKRTMSISDKIRHIKDMILQKISFSFKTILQEGNKTEIIISFLAVLELVKQRTVSVEQSGLFSEITVSKNGQAEEIKPASIEIYE